MSLLMLASYNYLTCKIQTARNHWLKPLASAPSIKNTKSYTKSNHGQNDPTHPHKIILHLHDHTWLCALHGHVRPILWVSATVDICIIPLSRKIIFYYSCNCIFPWLSYAKAPFLSTKRSASGDIFAWLLLIHVNVVREGTANDIKLPLHACLYVAR